MRLLRIFALVAFVLALTPSPAVAVTGFDSAYSGESAFVTLNPGETASFQVFFMNTGTVAWSKGSDTQVDLAQCLADKVTCSAQDPGDATWNNGWMSLARYATHTQAIVSTGSLATFAYNIKAPSNATGTHRFNGDLVLAKTGDRIHPEGYYQDATVEAIGSVAVPTPTPTPGSTHFPSPPPPTGTPTPTPTPTPELGTLTVNGSLTATGCPGPNFELIFVGAGLVANTAYQLQITRTTPLGVDTQNISVTTNAQGGFGFGLATSVESMPPPGTLTVVVVDDGTPKTNSVTATFVCAADLSVTKTDSPDPVLAGLNLTYVITVSNDGPEDAELVSVSDVIPANTTFVSFSQTSGPAFTLDNPAAGGTGTVTATASTFADEESATFTLVVKVNGDTPGGTTITNTATVTSATTDLNSANNTDTEMTQVLGTLTVNEGVAATGCPGPDFTLTFAGGVLTADTTYHMTFTRTTPPPVIETFGFDFTTDADGNFSVPTGTVGAPAPSTFTMVVTDDGTPVTNSVGVTFACP